MSKKHRDAGTGKYVTKGYADSHKKTTVSEADKPKPKGGGQGKGGKRR